MKKLLLLFLLVNSFLFANFSLKERILKSSPGDYTLFLQGKTVSLLLIREQTDNLLLIEEISAPEYQLKNKNLSEWVQKGAPGHTSWILYEIDLQKNELLESFSHSRNAWLLMNEEEHFLARLLSLKLTPVSYEDRKKIGPPPRDGERDHRSVWSPPLIIEGKRNPKPKALVYSTIWPKDHSPLANKKIDLYFSPDEKYPLPFWIQLSSGMGSTFAKALNMGKNLSSPSPKAVPRRYPEFTTGVERDEGGYYIEVKCPKYFQDFELVALTPNNQTITIPFSTLKNSKEHLELSLDLKELSEGLTYQMMLLPKKNPEYFAELKNSFTKTPAKSLQSF